MFSQTVHQLTRLSTSNDLRTAAERTLLESLLNAQKHAAQRQNELAASFALLNTHVTAQSKLESRTKGLKAWLQAFSAGNVLTTTPSGLYDGIHGSLESCACAVSRFAEVLGDAAHGWVQNRELKYEMIGGSYLSLGSHLRSYGRRSPNTTTATLLLQQKTEICPLRRSATSALV